MISGRGYGFLGSAGGEVMEYPQRKKEGLLEINEHFIHSKEYGFRRRRRRRLRRRRRRRLCELLKNRF